MMKNYDLGILLQVRRSHLRFYRVMAQWSAAIIAAFKVVYASLPGSADSHAEDKHDRPA